MVRAVTASIMRSVVISWAICESRKLCSRVGECANSLASSSTDPFTDPSNVFLSPSFEGELGRENKDDSPNDSNVGTSSGRPSGPRLGVSPGGPNAPVLMSQLVCDEEHDDCSSVDESVVSQVYTVRGDLEHRSDSLFFRLRVVARVACCR